MHKMFNFRRRNIVTDTGQRISEEDKNDRIRSVIVMITDGNGILVFQDDITDKPHTFRLINTAPQKIEFFNHVVQLLGDTSHVERSQFGCNIFIGEYTTEILTLDNLTE